MKLKLIRKYLKENYTIGKLYVNDMYVCDTLEDKIRDLQDYNHDGDFNDEGEGKIYGQTAIPAGTYRVIVTDSPKLKRRLPILLNVPGFTGIRIHGGKNAKWSEGCLLVGENKSKGELSNFKYWETTVTNMIEGAIFNGETCYITIKQ